jgi:hypothetical protein
MHGLLFQLLQYVVLLTVRSIYLPKKESGRQKKHQVVLTFPTATKKRRSLTLDRLWLRLKLKMAWLSPYLEEEEAGLPFIAEKTVYNYKESAICLDSASRS